jgi:DNA primase
MNTSPFKSERKQTHTPSNQSDWPHGGDAAGALPAEPAWSHAEPGWAGGDARPGWTGGARGGRAVGSRRGGRGQAAKRWQHASPGAHGMPAPRAEHAARLLLAQMALWETLSETEHGLLCAQPDPVGQLIRWLDAHFQDHGAVAWGVLSEHMRGQPFADFADQLVRMHKDLTAPQSAAELEDEMRSIMFGIRRDACAAEATRAAQANDIEGLRRARQARAELDQAVASWTAKRAES